MVIGVPPLLSKLRTRTLLGVLNAPKSLDAAVEAILYRKGQFTTVRGADIDRMFSLNFKATDRGLMNTTMTWQNYR